MSIRPDEVYDDLKRDLESMNKIRSQMESVVGEITTLINNSKNLLEREKEVLEIYSQLKTVKELENDYSQALERLEINLNTMEAWRNKIIDFQTEQRKNFETIRKESKDFQNIIFKDLLNHKKVLKRNNKILFLGVLISIVAIIFSIIALFV